MDDAGTRAREEKRGDFSTIEAWEREHALQAHFAKHAEALERAKQMLDGEPTITVLEAR